MKSLFIILFLFLFSIISLPLYVIEEIIGISSPHKKIESSQKIVVGAFNIILKVCGIKKTVLGVDRVPQNSPVLFVSNHRSYFDILIGYTSVPHLTGFVAKKEMKKIPCISRWMQYLNCLFLDRENVREGLKTILEGVEHIKHGYSIFIAPEGTRSQKEEMLPFREGSFKIAEKTGCAIIPVSISNTDAIFEQHIPWVKKAHVIIEFGEPLYPNKLAKEQKKLIGNYVQSIIRETLQKNKVLV